VAKKTERTVRSSVGHEIARDARWMFERALTRKWSRTHLEGPEDFGLDYVVDIFDSLAPVGLKFFVQLKGVEHPKIVGASIRYALETKNLATYVDTEKLPVFLVLANLATGQCHYVCMQEHAEAHLPGDRWRAQEKVTIKVPLANDVADFEGLREAVRRATSTLLATHASPGLALQRRVQILERKDPRLRVIARIVGGVEKYEIRAKSEVRLVFAFKDLDPERLQLLRSAKAIVLKPGELTISGSPIFENVDIQQLRFANEFTCLVTLEVRNADEVAALHGLEATVTSGLDRVLRIEASSSAPVDLQATLTALSPREDEKEVSVATRVEYEFDDRWTGHPVAELPHLDDVIAFARVSSKAHEIRMTLHIAGRPNFVIPWGAMGAPPDFDPYMGLINAISVFRDVARLVGRSPRLPSQINSGDIDNATALLALLRDGEFTGPGDASTFDGVTVMNADTRALVTDEPKPFVARTGETDMPWHFLGETVRVPVDRIALSNATCRVSRLKSGQARVQATGVAPCEFFVALWRPWKQV
jgi:hypothetical protein